MDDERKEEKPKIESKRKEMSSFVARKIEKRKMLSEKMTRKEIAALPARGSIFRSLFSIVAAFSQLNFNFQDF